MDRSTAPQSDHFPTATTEDWAVFAEAYADLVADAVGDADIAAANQSNVAPQRLARRQGARRDRQGFLMPLARAAATG